MTDKRDVRTIPLILRVTKEGVPTLHCGQCGRELGLASIMSPVYTKLTEEIARRVYRHEAWRRH